MRRLAWATLFLLACAKKAPEAPTAAGGPNYPDLKCATGTAPAGLAPPQGFEVWCQSVLPSGEPQREGPSIAWHPNEQRSAEGAWSVGRRTGTWQYWYPNGQLEKTGSYTNGVEDGVWVSYHENGQRMSEGQMIGGKESGAWSYWTEDGQTRTDGQWRLGLRDGVWTDFAPGDVPVREKIWRDGRLITQRELAQ
jgi:antitoxin component YwqK of YwqJK toxin-antitoxin module